MKNKFLYVFFAVTALLLCFVFSVNAAFGLTDDEILELEEVENYHECFASGDVDNSGSIEAEDARFILRLSVNLEKIDTSFFMKADVDGDGKITAADAREALRLAVGLDDAPAHTVEEIVLVPATCATDGLTVKVCTSCVKIYAKVTLPATTDKHITGFWETVKMPDCSNKGLAQLKCLVCDTVVKETELSPTNKHSGEWEYPEGKDCFNPVNKTRTCTVCGTVENKVENPQGGHSFKWYATVEKTCTEDGVQVNKCSNCGFVKEEAPLPATGHIFEYETVINEPSCEGTGLKAKKCVKCDHTEAEYATPALGHDYDNKHYKVTKEPSCAEEGSADVVCSRCGDAKELVLEKIPHTLTGKWTETLAPSCTEEGEKAANCRYCGDVTEKISAKGHDVTKWINVKPASCTEPGIMQGECKTCGDVAATKEIEILPHSFDKTTVYWTSGIRCKENANGYYKCKDCDAKQDVILLQVVCTSKNFKETKVITEATCTEKKTVVDVCDYCKEPIAGTEKTSGTALGHDYTGCEWVTITPATCTEDGLREGGCKRCGEIIEEVIAATGHTPGEWTVTEETSCAKAGKETLTCSVCNETIDEKEIAAAGHTPGEWTVTEETSCAKAGKETLSCSVCNEAIDEKEIATTEHTPVKAIIADSAEVNEDGHFIVKCRIECSVCGHAISEEEPVTRIAVNCNDESIKVVFDALTDIAPGSDVYFTVDGAEDASLFVMVTYDRDGSEVLEEDDGVYSFTIPEDLAETETITIVVAKLA